MICKLNNEAIKLGNGIIALVDERVKNIGKLLNTNEDEENNATEVEDEELKEKKDAIPHRK